MRTRRGFSSRSDRFASFFYTQRWWLLRRDYNEIQTGKQQLHEGIETLITHHPYKNGLIECYCSVGRRIQINSRSCIHLNQQNILKNSKLYTYNAHSLHTFTHTIRTFFLNAVINNKTKKFNTKMI